MSMSSGYSSSAIRERIYFGEKTQGILLYTGSSDKEGSLGGLVELGTIDSMTRLMRDDLVFTNDLGKHIATFTLYKYFKEIVTKIGLPGMRFHDLRHGYATLALQNGVDVKTVLNNLGHSTTAFTMDKYGHVTETMMKDSADKMQRFIESL